jgi:hypothetical protein
LETVALEHMGARHFTVAEHKALEREALVTERQAFARLDAAQAASASRAAARKKTAWFRPRPNARDAEPGRGFIDAEGRLHTWNESEGAHADVQRAGGHESIADLIIRRDGTVFATGGVARPGRALLIAEPEAVARAVAQDSRLKPSKAMAEDPRYQKALARARSEYAETDVSTLRRDALAAREHRMLVSGRPPEKVRAHEHWAREVARKDAVYKRLSAEHARLHAKRQRLHGAQSVRHGHDAAKAVKKGRADLKQVNEQIAALNKRMSRVKAEHRLARVKAERHGRPDISPAIRYGENVPAEVTDLLGGRRAGQHLPNEDIEAFLRHRGRDPETVGHLPHKGEAIGKRAYYKQERVGARGTEDKQVRTGSLYQRGGVRTTAAVLKDQGVKQAVQINHARQLDRFISEHAMLHPAVRKADKGVPLTAHEEQVVKRRRGVHGGGGARGRRPAVPRHAAALRAGGVASGGVGEHARGDPRQLPGAGRDGFARAAAAERPDRGGGRREGRPRNVGLMSGHLYDRMNEHLKPSGPLMRAAQVLNRAFRWTVLPQMRWLTGNFVEPYIVRLTAHGSGINVAGLGASTSPRAARCCASLKRSGDPELRQAAHGHGGEPARRPVRRPARLDAAARARGLPDARRDRAARLREDGQPPAGDGDVRGRVAGDPLARRRDAARAAQGVLRRQPRHRARGAARCGGAPAARPDPGVHRLVAADAAHVGAGVEGREGRPGRHAVAASAARPGARDARQVRLVLAAGAR